jgi:hypothetical protein
VSRTNEAAAAGVAREPLYAVESDPALNPFAVDAEPILGAIARHDVKLQFSATFTSTSVRF